MKQLACEKWHEDSEAVGSELGAIRNLSLKEPRNKSLRGSGLRGVKGAGGKTSWEEKERNEGELNILGGEINRFSG